MEKTLRYKNGNRLVYREFNETTWKWLTEKEKAMWTKASEKEPAPISKETIEFNDLGQKPKKTTKKIPLIEEEEIKLVKEQLDKLGVKYNWNTGLAKLKLKLEENATTSKP